MDIHHFKKCQQHSKNKNSPDRFDPSFSLGSPSQHPACSLLHKGDKGASTRLAGWRASLLRQGNVYKPNRPVVRQGTVDD
ncbi:hypothetical protein J6590_039157 [Homalodisca vitripennis]|nr:hypothetical protein J6590_039157 [Homalodisca vitripennis]